MRHSVACPSVQQRWSREDSPYAGRWKLHLGSSPLRRFSEESSVEKCIHPSYTGKTTRIGQQEKNKEEAREAPVTDNSIPRVACSASKRPPSPLDVREKLPRQATENASLACISRNAKWCREAEQSVTSENFSHTGILRTTAAVEMPH